jgi:hypothetical protein
MGEFINIIGFLVFLAGLISIFKPMRKIGIKTRKTAIGVIIAGFALSALGVSLIPPSAEEIVMRDKIIQERIRQEVETAEMERKLLEASTYTAEALWLMYEQNEVAADEVLKDTKILVTGEVDSIGKEITGKPYVKLRTKHYGGNAYGSDIQCVFDRNDRSMVKLRPGDEAKIKGIVSGKFINVVIKDCELMSE